MRLRPATRADAEAATALVIAGDIAELGEADYSLGGALLKAVFAVSAAAGQRQVRLNVASDNPNAVRLYERVGMAQHWRVDAYERLLPD